MRESLCAGAGSTNGAFGLFRVELQAVQVEGHPVSVTRRRMRFTGVGTKGVFRYRWLPPGPGTQQFVVFVGEFVHDATWEVRVVDVADVSAKPITLASHTSFEALDLGVDAQGRVYYQFPQGDGGATRLFRSTVVNPTPEQVPGTALTNEVGEADIIAFSLSPSGTHVAFVANAPAQNYYEVYTLDLSTNQAVRVSDTGALPTTFPSGVYDSAPVWSPDETRLAIKGNWLTSSSCQPFDVGIFVLPTTAPAGGVRVLGACADAGSGYKGAGSLAFSRDSKQLFLTGALQSESAFGKQLYATSDFATAAQDPASLCVEPVPPEGGVKGYLIK